MNKELIKELGENLQKAVQNLGDLNNELSKGLKDLTPEQQNVVKDVQTAIDCVKNGDLEKIKDLQKKYGNVNSNTGI